MTIKALYLHGYQTVGEVVVVMGVADPVALPLLGLDLDGEHAWQGGEGGVKVGGGAGAVNAWSRRWEATRATLFVEGKPMEGSELENGVPEVGELLPVAVSAKAVVYKVSEGGRWTNLCWSVMISPEGSPSDLHG